MRFNPALVSSFLFASAFLFNGVRPEFDILASSTLKADNGNYESIHATFHAPSFFALDHSFAGIGVAMDDFACKTVLVAGVFFGYDGEHGGQFWRAWYQLAPDGQTIMPDIPISAGDKITIVLRASSGTSATVTIHNHNNGQSKTNSLNPSHAFCRNQAMWFFGVAEDNVLPSFGMVEIMGAKATGVATGTQEAGWGELQNMVNHTTTLVTTSHASDFSTLIFKQD